MASLTFDEMLSSIQKRQFDLDDLLKLVEWYKQSDVQNEIFSKSLRDKNIKRLLNVVTVQIQEKNDVILQPLAQVKYYVKNKALRQLPLPEGTAHRKIAAICKKDLGFGWTELLFSEWWKFAKRNPQFFVGEFPESSLFVNSGSESSQRDQYFKIFTFIAKQHAQATDQLKQDIVTFLNNRPCILVDSSVPNCMSYTIKKAERLLTTYLSSNFSRARRDLYAEYSSIQGYRSCNKGVSQLGWKAVSKAAGCSRYNRA